MRWIMHMHCADLLRIVHMHLLICDCKHTPRMPPQHMGSTTAAGDECGGHMIPPEQHNAHTRTFLHGYQQQPLPQRLLLKISI